jgi:hypothetical protein
MEDKFMATNVILINGSKVNYPNWETTMAQIVKQDPHWQEEVNAADKEKLKANPPYQDYILSKGADSLNFTIHYFNYKEELQESTFSIDLTTHKWRFLNCFDVKLPTLPEIIAHILQRHD